MEKVSIYIENDGRTIETDYGTILNDIRNCKYQMTTVAKTGESIPVLAALVDNKLKELDFPLVSSHHVRFIGYDHPHGKGCYVRSLCFVLQAAVRKLFPEQVLIIDYSLPTGLYCEIRGANKNEDGTPIIRPLSHNDLAELKAEMTKIIEANIPLKKTKMNTAKAEEIFRKNNQPEKATLLESIGRDISSVYWLGDCIDTFYGPLVPTTGLLTQFDIIEFRDGFCLQYPNKASMTEILPMQKQGKIANALKIHSDWCSIVGVNGVGALNKTILDGKASDLINLAEARHCRAYSAIADMIFEQRDTKRIVFIAGPSSSGKTSTSLRLALQLKVLGLKPKVIELDNYFVNRELTPRDADGNYDFEALEAMDLKLLGEQINALLNGERVEIPRFDFKQGRQEFLGNYMQLGDKDILIMEGIHALNPAMIPSVDQSKVFRVYASALTSLSIDENNNISTADNRLLRRIVRDNRVRGITPEQTIIRWPSVRRGENRNIFPFQENADAVFNSALLFELPMLKYYAEPVLKRISPTSPAYAEAVRLLKFLEYIVALTPEEIAVIPPTSIMREFIGGQVI